MRALLENLLARWLMPVVVLGAAVLIGLQAGPIIWLLLGHSPSDEAINAGPPRVPSLSMAVPGQGVERFASTDPFGSYVVAQESATQLAETGLGLSLIGVLLASDSSGSRAFIERDGEVAPYREGDAIPGVARIDAIHRGYVVLEVGATLETLSLPEPDAVTQRGGRRAASGGAASIRARLSPSAQSTSTSSSTAGASGPAAASTSPQAIIDQYRRRIDENPQEVLDSLALQPGEAGYRVGDDPPEAVRRAGLQTGDVVTRVNGRAVGNVEADRRLYDLIAAEGRARVEVRRGDRTVTLTFPLQ